MKKNVFFKFREYFFISFFIFIALILTIIWYHTGKLIAGGEEGVFFYNPSISLKLFSSFWYESGTGTLLPVFPPRITLLFIPYLLTHMFSIAPWYSQAIIIFLCLSSAMIGMFCLMRIFLKDESFPVAAITTALFYVFNLYTQSQIIGRLLLTGIVMWAYMPLFILLNILWMETKKWYFLLFIICSSFIFSSAYGMPTNIVTLWVPVIIWALVLRIQKKRFFANCKLLLITFFVWTISNVWWLYPYIAVGTNAFSGITGSNENFMSLLGVSKYYPTSQILLLRQSFLFQTAYYSWYQNPWVTELSVFVSIIAGYGIIKSRRNIYWWFLILFLFIGWFVSKGTNPPFGRTLFAFVFNHIPSLQVFRNPYEKFGINFMLPFAVFFGIGIQQIIARIPTYKKWVIWGVSISVFCFVLCWPMVNGDVFGAGVLNVRVTIPPYYQQMNDFLVSQQFGRILRLPLIDGDSIRYLWPGGSYTGADASDHLFVYPSVSRILRAPYVDGKYEELYKAFIKNAPLDTLLGQMGVHYIILHNDIDNKSFSASSSAQIKEILSNNNISYKKTFGKLDLYIYNATNAAKFCETQGSFPGISYKRISATHYDVVIQDAKEPFTLLCKETYNTLWQARIGKDIISQHTVAYGYANAWKISKKGNFTVNIVLKIWPWD